MLLSNTLRAWPSMTKESKNEKCIDKIIINLFKVFKLLGIKFFIFLTKNLFGFPTRLERYLSINFISKPSSFPSNW